MIGYLYLSLALGLAAYGNIVLKYCMNKADVGSLSGLEFVQFYLHFFFLTAWGWSCVLSIAFCCLFWFAALSRFDLSIAIPFLSLNFVLVTLLSILILNEPFSWNKIIGVCVIVLGVFIASRGG